jgi:hypothetical protein
MKRTARVLLRWLVTDSELPRGKRFSVSARFDRQGDDWTSDAWSLVIEAEEKPDAKRQQAATAWFLADAAPKAWLAPGKKFTLFTLKPIAEGLVERVLSD